MQKKSYTVEQLYRPDYLDKNSIIAVASPWQLECLTYGNKRIYWSYTEDGEPIFYWGVSSFIRKALPSEILGDRFLRSWMLENFKDLNEYNQFMDAASSYGSFLHWQIKKFVEDGKIVHHDLSDDLTNFLIERGLNVRHFHYQWLESAKAHLLSWRAFCRAYNFRPMAIEFPIAGYWGVASRIDAIGLIDIPLKRNGTPYSNWPTDTSKVKNWARDVLAIGDIKSKLYSKNRSTFYKSNAYQLFAYRRLWNDAYKHLDLDVDFVFNWSPSNSPHSFNFKAWTDVKYTPQIEKEEKGGKVTIPEAVDLSFSDKGVHPDLLDDIIAFHKKWFANKTFSLKVIRFNEIDFWGEDDGYSWDELNDVARKRWIKKQKDKKR